MHDQAIAPPRHERILHRDRRSAMPSAAMQHVERENTLTEVEVRLNLYADVATPHFLEVSMPLPHPGVTVKDRAPDRRKRRIELNGRIAIREYGLNVASVERIYEPTMALHVLPRHRLLPQPHGFERFSFESEGSKRTAHGQ